jgi:isopentenyl-diphosphate delta-isomerase
MEPLLILVDKNDREIGHMNKLEAHKKGLLHRAVSVLIFDTKGNWLLQKRASTKYHSPSLWSNTCCSHPLPGEKASDAAKRRLIEEMGIEVNLEYAFKFTYRTDFDNGLTEYELDHVFTGVTDTLPSINKEEADGFEYIKQDVLLKNMAELPNNYSEWFKILVPKVIEQL